MILAYLLLGCGPQEPLWSLDDLELDRDGPETVLVAGTVTSLGRGGPVEAVATFYDSAQMDVILEEVTQDVGEQLEMEGESQAFVIEYPGFAPAVVCASLEVSRSDEESYDLGCSGDGGSTEPGL